MCTEKLTPLLDALSLLEEEAEAASSAPLEPLLLLPEADATGSSSSSSSTLKVSTLGVGFVDGGAGAGEGDLDRDFSLFLSFFGAGRGSHLPSLWRTISCSSGGSRELPRT